MKELDANVARISTAAVEIKILQVSGKQMTLAVFRQIPWACIFDRQGKLTAELWGWVNYDAKPGMRVLVFSRGGKLSRCEMPTGDISTRGFSDGMYSLMTGDKVLTHWPCFAVYDEALDFLDRIRETCERDFWRGIEQLYIAV